MNNKSDNEISRCRGNSKAQRYKADLLSLCQEHAQTLRHSAPESFWTPSPTTSSTSPGSSSTLWMGKSSTRRLKGADASDLRRVSPGSACEMQVHRSSVAERRERESPGRERTHGAELRLRGGTPGRGEDPGEERADPEVADAWGNTALMYATVAGHSSSWSSWCALSNGWVSRSTGETRWATLQRRSRYLQHTDCLQVLQSHSREFTTAIHSLRDSPL